MIKNVVLLTTETEIIITPAEKEYTVLAMMVCNTSTVERSVTFYAYNNTIGIAGNSTTFIKNLVIPAEDTYTWTSNEKLILGPNELISGIVSVHSAPNPVTVLVTYLEL